MATSGVTPDDIDTNLDRPLTPAEIARLTRWITDAETLISTRAASESIEPNPAVYAMVVRMAVENRWEHSRNGGASAVTVAVDDGTVTRRYENGRGSAWWFLGEWWGWLMPGSESGAFSTRPGFEPDRAAIDPWTTL